MSWDAMCMWEWFPASYWHSSLSWCDHRGRITNGSGEGPLTKTGAIFESPNHTTVRTHDSLFVIVFHRRKGVFCCGCALVTSALTNRNKPSALCLAHPHLPLLVATSLPFLTAIPRPAPLAISSPSVSALVPLLLFVAQGCTSIAPSRANPVALFLFFATETRPHPPSPEGLRWAKNLIFCRISFPPILRRLHLLFVLCSPPPTQTF
jgi:hypothetical protein